ncbi:protein DA1-related 1-like [Rhododendron vialii]|uniref:protein DA1-related 1-like n=1 Tax=Rhododendron vialii TaxID=182163 RepID=UPI00266016D4|nr:protein DA1-related 1-like [Rhododendron vialii]
MAEGSRREKFCDVCGKPENRSHPMICTNRFWGSTYCQEHKHDNTASCCSCQRFQGRRVKYVDVGDGRKLCPDCLSASIMDTRKCEPLARGMYEFFNNTLNLKFETYVPVLLVDKEELLRCVLHGRRPQPNRRHGLGTIAAVPQNITTVVKCAQRGDEIEVVKEVVHVTGRKVTAIVIIYGLPMVTTGVIMAHEMMHAWIRQQGWFVRLERKVEEGMCQLISRMWLEGFASDDQFTKSLREMSIFYIENDGHGKEIYGDGFREAKQAVDKYGLKTTLKHIAKTGSFNPPPARVPAGCFCFQA